MGATPPPFPPIQFCPRCGARVADELKFGKPRRVCPSCGYIHFVNPKVAVASFVEQDGKILLVKRAVNPEIGKWALPAGYVDGGEDPALAAIRETGEETGLTIEVLRLIDVIFDGTVILIVYEACPIGGTLGASDDAEAVDFFGPDELPELAFRSTQLLVAAWRSKFGTQGEESRV